MSLTLFSAPAVEPVSTAEAKTHLRVTGSDSDTYIDTLIAAARRTVEHDSGRALITQTWDWTLDGFPDADHFDVPFPPLQSVTSVTYTDTNGDSQTFSSGDYIVDTASEQGRIALEEGESWPTTKPVIDVVTVRFIAGYGDASTDVPDHLLHAVKLLIAHWYENREILAVGTIAPAIAETYEALIARERVWRAA